MKHIFQSITTLLIAPFKRPYDSARMLYFLAALIGCVSVVLLFWFLFGQFLFESHEGSSLVDPNPNEEERENSIIPECEHMRLLDGVCVQSEQATKGRYIAIMVENHFEANPLSGIADASVVYEAPVEGHIPRLLAIYPIDTDVPQVGPVRSARPYYLDWVSEYGDALYMHVGGSPEALEKIWAFGLFDMNEFSRGWYYWRATDRYAPHNAYTSSKLWRDANERYGKEFSNGASAWWSFRLMDPCQEDCVSRIDIEQSVGGYDVAWLYTSSTRQYMRTQFGRSHADTDGTRYIADTILLQRVHAEVVDEVGRLHIDTIGEGDGYVFRDGYAIQATWKKEGRSDKTRWFDMDGKEIALKPGKIWVQVVSEFGSVHVTLE